MGPHRHRAAIFPVSFARAIGLAIPLGLALPLTAQAQLAHTQDPSGDSSQGAATQAQPSVGGTGALQLAPVDVAAPPVDPGPVATVSRAEINLVPPLSPADIFTEVPGVWFQSDGGPGLSVSIRGMQDFGRVNVMIDGARQDFQASGHGANGTVYIDPALLAGADITRGTTSTAGGAGAIAGQVNLRTIGTEDVLKPGQTYGALATMIGGTNHYDASGMMAVAMRPSEQINMIGAASFRTGGNYAAGNGDTQNGTAQQLRSGLVKLEVKPDNDQTVRLGAVFYGNSFGASTEGVNSYDTVSSSTVTANYHLAPKDNPLLDLKGSLYFVETTETQDTDAFYGTSYAPAENATYKLDTLGGTLANTSRFHMGPVNVSVNYGGEYVHDQVNSRSTGGVASQTPSGNRGLGGVFTEATFGLGPFALIGGLRGDHYSLTGSGTNTYTSAPTVGYGAYAVDKSAAGVSPKITMAYTVLPGAQLYGSYGDGWRPPALTETIWSGTHPGLSFLRFVPNPNLDPETTHGWEFGVNLDYRDVLQGNDTVKLKADYFRSNIDDYIAQFLTIGAPASGSRIPTYLYYYQNVSGTTVSQGFELQASYDSGPVFSRIAYSNIITTLPGGNAVESGSGHIPTEPPRNLFSTTLGFRFLDQRLTLGARVKAASESDGAVSSSTGLTTTLPGYAVLDLFGSYQVTPNVKLFASAQNVTNKTYYTDALSADASPGLTALFGVTVALGK